MKFVFSIIEAYWAPNQILIEAYIIEFCYLWNWNLSFRTEAPRLFSE